MSVGMLWIEKTTDIACEIEKAVKLYQTKYGGSPNLCCIHPSVKKEFKFDKKSINGITIRYSSHVSKGYLWIGFKAKK